MNNDLVVMSNPLVEGRYSYTEIEAKLIYTVVSKIELEHEDFFKYTIEAKNIGTYKDVKKNCKTLLTKPFEVKQEGSKNFAIYNLFSSLKYENGYIIADFHPDLKPLLFSIKKELGFTKFGLKNIMNLNSRYLIRLYTLFKKEQFKTIWEIDFKELCELLQVPKSYYAYKNFKNEILNKLEEINTKTDIYITYKIIKKGRSVDKIKFIIQKDDFENFVKDIRKKYQKGVGMRNIILYKKDADIWTLNANGHIEKNNEVLTPGLADVVWKVLYEESKKGTLKFSIE